MVLVWTVTRACWMETGREGLLFLGEQRVKAEGEEIVVVIDPGHGGKDVGARGVGGTLEKGVTLEAAQIFAKVLLEKVGLKVLLTRTGDYTLSLEKRAALANTNRAVLFLSLHAGGAFNPKRSGALVFSLKPLLDPLATEGDSRKEGVKLKSWREVQFPFVFTSRRLAEALQENLNAFPQEGKGRETRGAPLSVLMGAKMPAALVELGCLSNPEEEARLVNPAYLMDLAEAFAVGIRQYRDNAAGLGDENGR